MSTHDTEWRHQQKPYVAIVPWQCLVRLPRSAVTLGRHGRLSLSQTAPRWLDGSPSSKSTHCSDGTLRVRASAPDVSENNKAPIDRHISRVVSAPPLPSLSASARTDEVTFARSKAPTLLKAEVFCAR